MDIKADELLKSNLDSTIGSLKIKLENLTSLDNRRTELIKLINTLKDMEAPVVDVYDTEVDENLNLGGYSAIATEAIIEGLEERLTHIEEDIKVNIDLPIVTGDLL